MISVLRYGSLAPRTASPVGPLARQVGERTGYAVPDGPHRQLQQHQHRQQQQPRSFPQRALPGNAATRAVAPVVEQGRGCSLLSVVSGDTLPILPLSHMTLDVSKDTRSRFCADPEWQRAQTYYVMRRDHSQFLYKKMKHLSKLIPAVDENPKTDCYDEDMFYWPLQVWGESVSNSCSMMTEWTGTDKYWKTNADRCKCPNFIASRRSLAVVPDRHFSKTSTCWA